MIKRLCMLESWHKIVRNLTHRGVRIMTILALAFVLVGASPSSFVQAAPANKPVSFFIYAEPSAKYVCAGQSMTFRVSVVRNIGLRNDKNNFGRISGVWIESKILDSSMGKITPDKNIGTFGETDYEPDVVEFTFTAGKNPGTAFFNFKTSINGFWMGAGKLQKTPRPVLVEEPAQVEVRQCGFTIRYWNTVPGNTGGLNCDSPYGPWDLRINPTNGTTMSIRALIPFSNDGKTTSAYLEAHDPSVVGFDAFGTSKVTFTSTAWGYQMEIASAQMVGRAWSPGLNDMEFNPVWGVEVDPGMQVFEIEPAQPGECSQP